MKKTTLLFCLFTISISYSQNSTYYGLFSPLTSNLVPYVAPKLNDTIQIIKPNFKGKELHEVNVYPTHYPDWVWQQHQTTEKVATATLNWQVQGVGTGISPPDPSGDADSLYYIQGTNSGGGGTYKIFNKLNGTAISATLTMQTLGGPGGWGDPIILYHKAARRWFITEFASTGNILIVHVSQTSNPQGAYFTYQFTCPNFPDYPKYGIWADQDAFVVSTNEGGPPRVYAMRLSNLLAGTASPFIGVPIGYDLYGFGFQSITPVDLDGDNPAPTGMKPTFMRHRDDESHSNVLPINPTNDWLEIWEMTINWAGLTATVAKTQDIAITEFDSDLCGLVSFSCIQQPTASPNQDLDPLRETVMYKVPMRVFSDHQAIVLSFATDVSGTNRAGVRWAELRRASGSIGNWSLYQEGTYSPGTTNRWMPAINMDIDGNIMMAYSTSSGTAGDFPSLKFTGRKPCDPLGQMTVAETTIITGASSRTSNTRWGDYFHMSIDPFLDNVFYFTGDYMAASNSIRTNVSSFKMNPDVQDVTIFEVFQVIPGTICGTGATVGVVIKNKGTNPTTSGTIQWQVGALAPLTQNYTTTQLTTIGSLDTIFITVTGLSNGANTVNFSSITANGLTPDDNACNDASTFVMTTAPGSLIVNNTINTQPSCSPGNDGQTTLSVSSGVPPYNYSFNGSPGQPTGVFNGIGTGTFPYTITDNVGCVGTGSATITNTTIITSTPNITSTITCFGDNTGVIQVTGSGGLPSYTYSIDGSTYSASANFTNLSQGTYTLYVQDVNGCIGSNSILLTEPTDLNLNAIPTAITCFGANDGGINASATNGTPGYTYSIDGVTYGASSTFNGLSAGPIVVYAIDNNSCTTSFSTTIIEPVLLSVTGVGTVATANDGTITLTGADGTSPYMYSIDGLTYQVGSLFVGLAGGTYTCFVQDNNGCTSQVDVFVSTSGLDELTPSTLQIVSLYPNPTSNSLTIELSGTLSAKIDIKLFNMNGQLVSQFSIPSANGTAKQTIELSKKIASGQYYIGIYDELLTPIISKIIKQ